MKKDNRKYAIDFIKVICTVLIVFHHYQMVTGLRFENNINFYDGKIYFGFIVELFFIISGLFMYRDEKKIDINTKYIDYIKGKAKRLLPLVCISAIVFTGLLVYYIEGLKLNWFDVKPSLLGTITASLGIQYGGVFKESRVNAPTWYINILLICYTIYFFIIKISKKKNISINAMCLIMILIGIGLYNYKVSFPLTTEYCVRGYYSFFFGVILGKYLYNSDKIINKKDILISIITILSIVLLTKYYYSFVKNGYNFILTFLLYPSILVILSTTKMEKILHFKFISFLARISYNVYIWHYPFLLLIHIILHKMILEFNLLTLESMLLYTLFCFIIGIISYLCIEIPIGKRLSKKNEF